MRHAPTWAASAIVALATIGGVAVLAWGSSLIVKRRAGERAERRPAGYALLVVALTVAACYLCVVVATACLFDASTPLDVRILAPFLVLLIPPLALCALAILRGMNPLGRARRGAALALTLAMICSLAFVGYKSFQYGREPVAAARSSEAMAACRGIPPQTRIYSNLVGDVWLVTGRYATSIPATYDGGTGAANPAFAKEVAEMAREVGDGKAVVVSFRYPWWENIMPREQVDLLLSRNALRFADGSVIYGRLKDAESQANPPN